MRRPLSLPTVADAARPRIEVWTADQFDRYAEDAMAIYAEAMGYVAQAGVVRARSARSQSTFPDFAARAAFDQQDRLIGFGYGYLSEHGQWWHEMVRAALTDEQAGRWMTDAFELSELHVHPSVQGRGVGRALLASLAAGLPHRNMLLSTPDADTTAMHLYRRMGFVDLARRHYFPGEVRPFAILGRHLPFEPS
jgi:ribosomal protein S18 acetylase RimI-like enzyme